MAAEVEIMREERSLYQDKKSDAIISEPQRTVPPAQEISFRDYIKRKQKNRRLESLDGKRDYLTITNIGKILGLKDGICSKLINQSEDRGRDHRDFVIAVCLVLELDIDETNTALRLYYDTPVLNTNSPRDACIMKCIHSVQIQSGRIKPSPSKPYSKNSRANDSVPKEKIRGKRWIQFTNSQLRRNGFAELNIINGRRTKMKPAEDTPAVQATSGEDESLYEAAGDIKSRVNVSEYPSDSLESKYALYLYDTESSMDVKDRSTGRKYSLTASSNGKYSAKPVYMEDYVEIMLNTVSYKNLEETGGFRDYFIRLRDTAQEEWEKFLLHLDDTRNYYERLCADISGDAIHIYMEKYNYHYPERRQFFMMEYINGQYRMSVSHESRFMALKLKSDDYSQYYKKECPPVIGYVNYTERLEKYHPLIARQYEEMKKKVGQILERLRDKRAYVRDFDEIWDIDTNRVCRWYGVEEQFKCHEKTYMIPDPDDPEGPGYPGEILIVADAEQSDFTMEDGTTVTITLDDLKRAFELGCDDIGQICRIKKNKGSIEAVLD